MMRSWCERQLLLVLLLVLLLCVAGAPRPHIISILQDDMGWWDSGVHSPEAAGWTGNITSLARQGVVLHNHYTHWHCSPSRRSFLTGRLPIHHGEQLSGDQTDDIDLRMAWLPHKLQQAGYATHWYGKWHTGFRSMNHLAARRGFNSSIGSFQTGNAYSGPNHSMRWQDEHPIWNDGEWTGERPKQCGLRAERGANASCTNEYSTDLWGALAVKAVAEHDLASGPLYVHLCFQAVHTPYDKAPGDPTGSVYRGMLWRADVYIGQLVATLKARGMYDNTLIVYSADNGGTVSGVNYPLRGEKHSNWEGGMRTAAFVSGGFLPKHLRGSNSSVTMHIVDWYATFAALAGVDPTDDPPVAPLPGDLSKPFQNIYGERSYPAVDGRNVWEVITQPAGQPPDAVHKHLVLSKETLISGKWKLLVAQPYFKTQNNGWKDQQGKWVPPTAAESFDCLKQTVPPSESFFPVPGAPHLKPCLFDVQADPSERHNLAEDNPQVVRQLWAVLNQTILTLRDCNGWSYQGTAGQIPGPKQPAGGTSCSPAELLGACNTRCAQAKWKRYGSPDGPVCGVPGCGSGGDDELLLDLVARDRAVHSEDDEGGKCSGECSPSFPGCGAGRICTGRDDGKGWWCCATA